MLLNLPWILVNGFKDVFRGLPVPVAQITSDMHAHTTTQGRELTTHLFLVYKHRRHAVPGAILRRYFGLKYAINV